MEIIDKSHSGFIEVWMTKDDQQLCDRTELTARLLSKSGRKKCRVVFFLSGEEDLCSNTEGLLLANLKGS